VEYINQERFEEMLRWMQLPQLLNDSGKSKLERATKSSDAFITKHLSQLKLAQYRYDDFVSSFNEDDFNIEPRKPLIETSTVMNEANEVLENKAIKD